MPLPKGKLRVGLSLAYKFSFQGKTVFLCLNVYLLHKTTYLPFLNYRNFSPGEVWVLFINQYIRRVGEIGN
jgi:hypothetical protein